MAMATTSRFRSSGVLLGVFRDACRTQHWPSCTRFQSGATSPQAIRPAEWEQDVSSPRSFPCSRDGYRTNGQRPESQDRSSLSGASHWDPTVEWPNPLAKDPKKNNIELFMNGIPRHFSPLLLRDMCMCPRCVDSSTRQKLFSTTDIPANIQAAATAMEQDGSATVRWENDIPGFGQDHESHFDSHILRALDRTDIPEESVFDSMPQTLWDTQSLQLEVPDVEFAAYLQDDSSLYKALQLLRTHGLLFLTNVPDSESSVSTIGERIGALKNSFYGYTWDVRSIPQAKNVAFTAQDLGFHMDLMYMKQPPHLQFLHCIRSSAAGGASLFTDSYKAASDLFVQDYIAFKDLVKLPVMFHYDHPESQYYQQSQRVIQLHSLGTENYPFKDIDDLVNVAARSGVPPGGLNIVKWINAVNWAPPFQAPFALLKSVEEDWAKDHNPRTPLSVLNERMSRWHAAATKFNSLIHRPEAIYERMMKPGECVIFDNRRVLHARKAFEVGDVGKERWLRGAYLDKDPFVSRLKVLQGRFGNLAPEATV